jgi:hypothetical protein
LELLEASSVSQKTAMAKRRQRRDTGKVRIVPYGALDAETIAEFAWRTKRASRTEIEVLPPRRVGDEGALLERTALDHEDGTVTLGLIPGAHGEVRAADPARGVGLVSVPAKTLDALVSLVEEALGAILPDAA